LLLGVNPPQTPGPPSVPIRWQAESLWPTDHSVIGPPGQRDKRNQGLVHQTTTSQLSFTISVEINPCRFWRVLGSHKIPSEDLLQTPWIMPEGWKICPTKNSIHPMWVWIQTGYPTIQNGLSWWGTMISRQHLGPIPHFWTNLPYHVPHIVGYIIYPTTSN
jgi:hypothetical protein